MNYIKHSLSVLTFLFISSVAMAEVAVIVHPSNSDAISQGDISKIYLGKIKKFPGGKQALPLDKSEGEALRVQFLDKVVKKSEQQMKSYWSRLIFTGKGVPPKILSSDAEIVETVSRNPDAIGYVDSSSVNDSVKVILAF